MLAETSNIKSFSAQLISLVFDKNTHLKRCTLLVKHVTNSFRMFLDLLKFFELYPRKLFFIVGRKEIHVLVSVGPSLLFGNLCDALDLFLLHSFALFNILDSFFCNKIQISISQNKILRCQLREIGSRRDNRFEFTHSNLWALLVFFFRLLLKVDLVAYRVLWWLFLDLQVPQLDFPAVCIIIPASEVKIMLSCLWVPARKYWETVFIVFLYEPFHDFPSTNDERFSTNNRMFLVEKVQIFSLRDIK